MERSKREEKDEGVLIPFLPAINRRKDKENIIRDTISASASSIHHQSCKPWQMAWIKET